MNFCLEMDLTCSANARKVYFYLLKITQENQTQKVSLEKNGSTIKKIKNIIYVLKNIEKISYPKSFQLIKNEIINRVNKL